MPINILYREKFNGINFVPNKNSAERNIDAPIFTQKEFCRQKKSMGTKMTGQNIFKSFLSTSTILHQQNIFDLKKLVYRILYPMNILQRKKSMHQILHLKKIWK